jgi:hypothetical protein
MQQPMKNLIYSGLVSLVSGLCFALGLFVVAYVVTEWDSIKSPIAPEPEFVRLPPEIRIAEHSRVLGTPSFTIRGVVENLGKTEWSDVSVKATITAGTAQVNTCETDVDGVLGAGARRAFQIECYGVAGSDTPPNLGYRLIVANAERSAAGS